MFFYSWKTLHTSLNNCFLFSITKVYRHLIFLLCRCCVCFNLCFWGLLTLKRLIMAELCNNRNKVHGIRTWIIEEVTRVVHQGFAKCSFLNNSFFLKNLFEIWADFFFFLVIHLEIFKLWCVSWTFHCGLCTKGFRNLFRNPWPLWDPINSCSVNAFLCKLYCSEFLKGFVRPELLALVCF